MNVNNNIWPRVGNYGYRWVQKLKSQSSTLLPLALVAGIAGAALVTSREQEGNIKKTENNIWLDFFHFDQRSFPFSSGIHGGVLDHVELEFWKNINPHCLQAPKGDPPPHLLDLGLLDILSSSYSSNFLKISFLHGSGRLCECLMRMGSFSDQNWKNAIKFCFRISQCFLLARAIAGAWVGGDGTVARGGPVF